MKNKISILITLSTIIILSSCGKYEEGPKISLKSKAARVAATWDLDAVIVGDEDVELGDLQYYTLTLEKDGTGKYENVEYTTDTGSVAQLFHAAEYDLEWQFDPNKERIKWKIKFDVLSEWGEYYTIIKLKEKEMWLTQSDTIQFHYVKNTETKK